MLFNKRSDIASTNKNIINTHNHKNKNSLIGLLVVALVVILIGGTFFFLANNSDQNPSIATSTVPGTPPSPMPAPFPEPVPARVAGVPLVTTDPGAAVANSTSVVTGKVTPNGSQTTYWYDYSKTTALDMHTVAQAIGSGFMAIPSPAYITGLTANTLYYFRLSAKNAYGTVNGTMYSFTTNSNPPPQAYAPTARTDRATGISRDTANAQGLINPNNSQTSYWFEYGESANLGNITAFQSAGSGNASMPVSMSLSGLKPLTTYYFRLNAQNQYGTVNGAILNFTTIGPPLAGVPAASTDAATKIATTSVVFNGQVNPDGVVTDAWFEYSTDSNLSNNVSSTPHQNLLGYTLKVAVTDMVVGLKRSTKYYYRVVASNSNGSAKGDIMNFRTK